ncbi:hypothetical protein BDZ89DRAFT_1132267 [Hymenopellis radicata]|nr:hypothetical protein BDZ89DRAFT_1132267 [Hymenopellis radicata]
MSSVKRRKIPKRTSQVSKKTEKSFVKTGELKTLLEMPLDILYEVCSHLTIVDALNMALTTKALRTLLMNKAWSSVWRAVLANDPDGFPPKPDDINEPQYAALICGLYCFKCGKDGYTSPLWCARQRLCEVCQRESKFMSSVYLTLFTCRQTG